MSAHGLPDKSCQPAQHSQSPKQCAGLNVSPKPSSTASLSFGHSAVIVESSPFLYRSCEGASLGIPGGSLGQRECAVRDQQLHVADHCHFVWR